MNELALFAGAGGGILGGKLLGWRTVCAVEYEPYAAGVLVARQNDGLLPPFPIWDDVRTFDGRPWRGIVDVVSGGFPCQDISIAGGGAGIDGERSGLWTEMARIIHEVRPCFVFVENSPMLTSRGLGRVLGDLASMGFNARWGVLGAVDAGAPHKRERIWIVGYSTGLGRQQGWNDNTEHDRKVFGPDGKNSGHVANSYSPGQRTVGGDKLCIEKKQGPIANDGRKIVSYSSLQGLQKPEFKALCFKRWRKKRRTTTKLCWWGTEPDVGRVAHGVAARVDRLKSLGNGQVPAVAALAFRILSGGLD